MSAQRPDTRVAVAGLFDRPSATGGLAGRDADAEVIARASPVRSGRSSDGRAVNGGPAEAGVVAAASARVRLGVELSERETGYLRSLSRPARTGGPRTLGSKFVATGVLTAAIEMLERVEVDMHGVAAGDAAEMRQRARDALVRAALHDDAREGSR
jgi:hypothetical protein